MGSEPKGQKSQIPWFGKMRANTLVLALCLQGPAVPAAVLPEIVTFLGLFITIYGEIVFMKMIQCCLFGTMIHYFGIECTV